MKFQGPQGINSISVGGECFNVGDDGLVETPDNGEYASLLAPHGFVPFHEKQATAPATGNEGGEGQPVTEETKTVTEVTTETAPATGNEKPAKKAK